MSDKPFLRMRQEVVHTVTYSDLQEFVKEVTGQQFDFVSNQECGNDTQHRFSISGFLGTHETEEWKVFKETGDVGLFNTRMILNGLCKEGFIPEGTYLIDVCW